MEGEDPDERYLVEAKDYFSEDELSQINEIVAASFPKKRRESLEFFREIIKNKRGVFLVIRNKKKRKIIGYMFSLPQEDAFDDYLKNADLNLKKDFSAFYIESVAVLPKEQRQGHYSRMFRRLLAEVRQRGYKKITAHGQSNAFTPLRDRYGARKIHAVQNCFNYGEPFDYLEYKIKKVA